MANPELALTDHLEKGYGDYYKASIELDDRIVTGAYREPRGGADTVYVLANGLLAGKDSLRAAAHEAARENYATLALDYSAFNGTTERALESNAVDVAAAIDSIPQGQKRRAAGMSKGGRVLILALAKANETVESATLVVPAGVSDMKLSWLGGAIRLGATGLEVMGMVATDPRETVHIGGTCVKNAIFHPRDILREMGELKTGHEHKTLHEVRSQEQPPFLRLVFGKRDLLIRANEISRALPGLPTVFDEVMPYPGGHIDFARNCRGREIARQIFRRDKELFGGGELPKPERTLPKVA